MKEIICTYRRRARAIENGVLIDVSTIAREAGIKFPVDITQAAWAECIAVGTEDISQDETRLWNMLNVLRYEGRQDDFPSLHFFEVFVSKDGRPLRLVRLKPHCGVGDEGEAVLTVMMPNED